MVTGMNKEEICIVPFDMKRMFKDVYMGAKKSGQIHQSL